MRTSKVAAEDGRAHLDGGDGADSALAVGGVSEAFYAVPQAATDRSVGVCVSVLFDLVVL